MFRTFSMIGGIRESSEATRMSTEAAARAESKAKSAARHIKILEANLAKTMMICESLWELLRDKTGMTDEDLHKKLYEVDMRDGVLDGKNQRTATECPDCGHMVSPRHPACIYCGRVIDQSIFTIG